MIETKTMPRPWYRQPLVWMVIAIPASAVFAGMVTIYLAISTSDGLVVDDYYKQGMAINQVLRRDIEASASQLSADLSVQLEERLVRLEFNKGKLADYPERLQLSLRNATSDDHDASIELVHGMGSQYIGYLKQALPAGAWYVELSHDNWRLNARSRLENIASVRLEAAE